MELLKSILGTFFRAILASAGGWLIAQGYITEADWNSLLAGGIMAAAALAWGAWQKYKSRLTFLAALELPAGSSEEEAKVKSSDPKIAARAFTLLLLVGSLAGGFVACAKKITGESAEDYKKRSVAIRVDQGMVGFDLAQDFLIVLSDYDVIGDANQPKYFVLHDRALSAFDVVAQRLKTGLPTDPNERQQLLQRIDAVIVDCDKIVQELRLLNDADATSKAAQVVSSIRLALNSIKIIIAAQSSVSQPTPEEVKAAYKTAIAPPKGPKPGWWDAAISLIANQVSKMLYISAYTDPVAAWDEASELSVSMHAENKNRAPDELVK